jgi:hypothetical protein
MFVPDSIVKGALAPRKLLTESLLRNEDEVGMRIGVIRDDMTFFHNIANDVRALIHEPPNQEEGRLNTMLSQDF